MTRWSHGHSIGVGSFTGLLLAQHVLWIVTVCLLAGFVAGRVWGGLVGVGQTIVARLNPVKAKVHRRAAELDDGIPY